MTPRSPPEDRHAHRDADIVDSIRTSVDLVSRRMDRETARHRLEEFNARVEDPTLWERPRGRAEAHARPAGAARQAAGRRGDGARAAGQRRADRDGRGEGDEGIVEEAEAALRSLRQRAAAKELEALLDGEADANDTFLEINAGAGGTESCDWAEMLSRMYVRWASPRATRWSCRPRRGRGDGHQVRDLPDQRPQRLWLAEVESGVHRLVRISPFGSGDKRQTSFASVWVYPVVDDNIEIEVQDKDIRIDTYRSSARAGSTSTRRTRRCGSRTIPTGIVVTSSLKSQHQNRDIAMQALKSRLYRWSWRSGTRRSTRRTRPRGDAGWGNQIRSYVLQPYQMVKDLRTGFETSDTGACSTATSTGSWRRRWLRTVAGKAEARAWPRREALGPPPQAEPGHERGECANAEAIQARARRPRSSRRRGRMGPGLSVAQASARTGVGAGREAAQRRHGDAAATRLTAL
jgi:peptide chain release factor 2